MHRHARGERWSGRGYDVSVAEALDTDLSDPALYATERPERVWEALRRHGRPVWMPGRRPHWAVTTHAQIRHVRRAPPGSPRSRGTTWATSPPTLRPPLRRRTSLLVSDGDRHAAMRAVLSADSGFRPLRRLTAQTRAVARRLINGALEHGEVDFVRAVAVPLPAEVVCALLGVPAEETRMSSLSPVRPLADRVGDGGRADASHAELFAYCDSLLSRKQARPDDDVASTLAAARIDGAPMPREMAIMNCHDLIAGGTRRPGTRSVPRY